MITDHKYDAGWPRDDSRDCIADVLCEDPTHAHEPGYVACGKRLKDHAGSEYPEDHEPPPYPKSSLQFNDDSYEHL